MKEVRVVVSLRPPSPAPAQPMRFPVLFPDPQAAPDRRTRLLLHQTSTELPSVVWCGTAAGAGSAEGAAWSAEEAERAAGAESAVPLLPEHWRGWFGRPGLSGHRLAGTVGEPAAGRDWAPAFTLTGARVDGDVLTMEAHDPVAQLSLTTTVESLRGGPLRVRHALANTGRSPYVVDHLDVVVPVPTSACEGLDFTGRILHERTPQRRPVVDGLWLRESRRGKPGADSATLSVVGTSGFGFADGEVWAVHVAWSGNQVYRTERKDGGLTIGGGELLLPGEAVLGQGETYETPWVYFASSDAGLDGLAGQFHGFLRSVATRPASPRPVNFNVWEAVLFRHDSAELVELAELAAEVGAERYVLDDGWFHGRRGDDAGLGDWWVDGTVFPDGLKPLVTRVRDLGMQFGIWIEPEMVNPDSDLYRLHPEWTLSTGDRVPLLERNQLVLDLSRPEVVAYLLEHIDALLTEHDIAYVKWDHNRALLDAGSGRVAGRPAVHAQTLGYYALLDELRRRHPQVEWESCSSGGARIDLEVLQRVERVWTSDMTDAVARQPIQRWTGQLLPPEYMGAHVAAPFSMYSGRYMPLAFRAATAFFGHFGIEWDVRETDPLERAALRGWVELYKRHRTLLHSGKVVRLDTPEGHPWMHGVVAPDATAALMACVQFDDGLNTAPVRMTIPGLLPERRYRVRSIHPPTEVAVSRADRVPRLPEEGAVVSGAVLGRVGATLPQLCPLQIVLLLAEAV
ncbi:alpha-galactosidase [Streptomyces sp. NPDC060194]|uniref:alpha-galactosidase n=1 Tax=Streptomyces sp. NPDC060194 TaxID=3347069 RepID=UPI003669DF1E